jgi:SAM-dependent methyltransferase
LAIEHPPKAAAIKHAPAITLDDVRAVYTGPEGDLWELLMGQQIHLGGYKSSLALADLAAITPGLRGVDLCCCNGAGMRFLVRFRGVAAMIGVDATAATLARGRARTTAEGLDEQIRFVHADVCQSGLPDHTADFVWGEDAWCYVIDKAQLVDEARRILKPGGIIAFTDWLLGPAAMTPAELARLLAFMKFPNLQTLAGYRELLSQHGGTVLVAEDTGRFAPCVDLYLAMVDQQLTYDALRILDFNAAALAALAAEMQFLGELAHAGKIIQGRLVAKTR